MNKIFCIGLSRTGTKSLTNALNILGYKAIHFPDIYDYNEGELKLNTKILKKYDAFVDTYVSRFFKELDNKYPGSNFILTVRDKKPWLRSCKKFFAKKTETKNTKKLNKLRKDLYNSSSFNKKKFSVSYDKHFKNTLSHFENRRSDLLITDICKGEGWEKLCPFLNKPYPKQPFPYSNKTIPPTIILMDKLLGLSGASVKILSSKLYSILKKRTPDPMKKYKIKELSNHEN